MIYHWHSAFMERYSKGDIIVCASSVEEAKALALVAIEAEIDRRKEDLWIHPDEEEEIAQVRQLALRDLEKEPTTHTALLIWGSE